jgi:hypothetical protein
MMYTHSHVYFCVSKSRSPRVFLCELGNDGVGELLRRGFAAKVTGDTLALRDRLSIGKG